MGRLRNKITADIALAAVLTAVAAGAYFITRENRTAGAYAVVYCDGEEMSRYPLDNDITVTIKAFNDGENVLTIEDGYADITDADCPDHTCVNMRRIRYRGESIICLPNKLTVKIEGGDSSGVDIPVK